MGSDSDVKDFLFVKDEITAKQLNVENLRGKGGGASAISCNVNLSFFDAKNIEFETTTGTKIEQQQMKN